MQYQYKKLITFGLTVLYWSLTTAAWGWVWDRYYSQAIIRPFGYKGTWLIVAVYGIILFLFNHLYGGYRIGYHKFGDIIYSNLLALLFTNGIVYLQTCLVGRAIMDIRPFVVLCVVGFLLALLWAYVSTRLYMKLYPPHKMLMIYGGKQLTESLIYKMMTRPEKYDICEAISTDEGIESIIERMKNYTSVIICDVKSADRNALVKYCFEHSVRTYLTPKISDLIIRGAAEINLFDTTLLLCRNTGFNGEQRALKRMLDLVLASLALVATAPFLLLTALAIKLQDGGPVLYRQERLTRGGKVFSVYKFRSMIVDAEKDSGARLAEDNDDRITPVGRFIRKIRFDEMPQLLNILKGDMSIVGPRPERPEIAQEYEKTMPEFCFRLKVKAGLTGYAQVLGKYNTTPYDKLKLDMAYIEGYSFLLDLKLILMTLKILFKRESTEGIAEGTTTASPPPPQKAPAAPPELVVVTTQAQEERDTAAVK